MFNPITGQGLVKNFNVRANNQPDIASDTHNTQIPDTEAGVL